MFGSAPVSVTVVVSDLDVTILSLTTPAVPTAGVVHVAVANVTSTTFAYTSPGVNGRCVSSVCEVDSSNGGSLTVRLTGLGVAGSIPLACTMHGSNATVTVISSTPVGPDSHDLSAQVPGMAVEPKQPLTSTFLSCQSSLHQVFIEVLYRRPPHVMMAQFSDDGSRLDVLMDQRTNSVGSTKCDMMLMSTEADAFGASPTCWWDADGQILQVLLGRGATVVTGSTISLFAGVVRSLNGVSAGNSRQQVDVQAPQIVLPPR
jgi:hypothetical protein